MSDTPAHPSSGWRVAAASVQGRSHEASEQLCQDAHAFKKFAPGLLAAALADGAGSASHSQEGAAVATATVISSLSAHASWPDDADLWRQRILQAVADAHDAVRSESVALRQPARALACTLLVLLASQRRVMGCQIGDGAILVADRSGGLFSLTHPEAVEYLNEAVFLVSDGAVEQATVKLWEGDAAHLAAITDGLQLLALSYPDYVAYAPFFVPLFDYLAGEPDEIAATRAVQDLLLHDRIRKRADDDLTLFLATLGS